MKQKLSLVASNSEAFPGGSQAWAEEDQGAMITLADQAVETITYSTKYVIVHTALGYHFTVRTTDYDQLVAL